VRKQKDKSRVFVRKGKKIMTEEQILDQLDIIYNKVKNLFTYVGDFDQFQTSEDFRSYKEMVNNNLRFKDDCDGFAITCGDIINDLQILNSSDISVGVCNIHGSNDRPNHAVCLVYLPTKTVALDHLAYEVTDVRDLTYYYWFYDIPFNNTGVHRDLSQEN